MKRLLYITLSFWFLIAGSMQAGATTPRSYKVVDGHKVYFKIPSEEDHYISETRYDYSKVAKTLTEGCKTDYEKIKAINDWMSINISYDTSYSIRTADECFDKKKGVCQGYCELFYRIAEAAAVKVEIVSGISRDIDGTVSEAGHAWLFAYTQPNYGILLDPTWDAGTVNGNVFKFNEKHGYWFNVDPEWMILMHYPNDESYQLLDMPMSKQEFYSLNYAFGILNEYGFDVHEIYTRARKHNLSIPDVYSGGVGDFTIVDAPIEAALTKGRTYTFRIKMLTNKDIVIRADKVYSVLAGDWDDESDGVYSVKITPDGETSIVIGDQTKSGNMRSFNHFIVYKTK